MASFVAVFIDDIKVVRGIDSRTQYEIISTGLIIQGESQVWTYSGSNQFLGFSTTQGATTAEYGVGSTGLLSDFAPTYEGIYLYSVEGVEPSTYYKVSSSDLTSVADAIRAKSGTTEALVYPDGFISAIENIV